jgi:hypothetical protein
MVHIFFPKNIFSVDIFSWWAEGKQAIILSHMDQCAEKGLCNGVIWHLV